MYMYCKLLLKYKILNHEFFINSSFLRRLMAFHGLEPAQQGGETVLVDGFRAAELLKIQNQKHYDNLRTVPIEWHYNSDEFLHINAIPIINTSKVTGELEQIR